MADKNKNNYIWIGIAVVAVIILAIVFISNSNKNSQNEVTCNSPYIKVGNSCCLEKNYNNVCDNDETQTQNQQTQQQDTDTSSSNTNTQDSTSLKEITFNEVNSQISVNNFEYTPINCNGGTCVKMNDPNYAAISRFSNSNDISKQFAFKVSYSPSSNENLYFQAYTSDTLNGFTTSNAIRLSPGENLVAMGKGDTKLNNNLELNLCFSYKNFFISNDDGIPKFFDSDATSLKEIDNLEYSCIKKVFDAPKISVSLNPSSLSYTFNQGGSISQEKQITVTNTGDSPVMFRFFVPSSSDGTNREGNKPNFYITDSADYSFVLQSGESHTSSILINLMNTSSAYYSDKGYVYTLSDCSALYLAECQENALYKESFDITTIVNS